MRGELEAGSGKLKASELSAFCSPSSMARAAQLELTRRLIDELIARVLSAYWKAQCESDVLLGMVDFGISRDLGEIPGNTLQIKLSCHPVTLHLSVDSPVREYHLLRDSQQGHPFRLREITNVAGFFRGHYVADTAEYVQYCRDFCTPHYKEVSDR